jgi:hypothetical protein
MNRGQTRADYYNAWVIQVFAQVPLNFPRPGLLTTIEFILIVGVMIAVRALLIRVRGGRGPIRKSGATYFAVDSILSPAELEFFSVLRLAVPTGFYICCKPRLGDLIIVPNQEGRQSARNRVDRKHVDFVLCEEVSMKPRLAIELDDRSHDNSASRETDDFKDEVLRRASISILRVPCRRRYDVRQLQGQIVAAIRD